MRNGRVVHASLGLALWLASGSAIYAAPPVKSAAPLAAARLEHLQIDGKAIDLHALPDSQMLRGNSGRQISVGRLKQLQAVLSGAAAPQSAASGVIKAAPTQNLKALAAMPANSRIQLSNGRVVSPVQLKRVDMLLGKLEEVRPARPLPRASTGVTAKIAVGPSLSLADALKRPDNEPIQVGKRVFTAATLRQIDSLLRADKKNPHGLVERAAAARKTTGGARTPSPSGPQFKAPAGTPIKTLLAKPDNTVLVSPHGKTFTVAQLKAWLQQNHLTAEQAESRFRKPPNRSRK